MQSDEERIMVMEKNKVKLTICGAEYIIGSDEDSKYMIELGDEVDEKISTILKQNPRISVTQAAVLAALEFADSEKKAVVSAENLRSKSLHLFCSFCIMTVFKAINSW